MYTWDRSTDRHHQLTRRPHGTYDAAIEPSGDNVWWFNDNDGDEFGVWHRQPFEGDRSVNPTIPGLKPSYPAGLALGRETVAIGTSNDSGSAIFVWPYAGEPWEVYRHSEDASMGALSADETLLAVAHSEHGDTLHPAIRVLQIDLTSPGAVRTVAELTDGAGKGVYPVEFSPTAGDQRLLIVHERYGRNELALWDLVTDSVTELRIDIPGELSAEWYRDASALLVTAEHDARSTVHRYDIASGSITQLDVPSGVVLDTSARPDGDVEYSWCNAANPRQIRVMGQQLPLLTPQGPPPPPSVPVQDFWVPGAAGNIHALVSTPRGQDRPFATVFSIHGGPHDHDQDRFDAYRAALVDNGYAVVEINYRGSTGYGSAWRDAIIGGPGLTELADINAVREWAIENGLADPARCVLAGYSWGGYLTLLGLGTDPSKWVAGIAGVPVADYVAAYEDEMEPLKAMDRVLFDGAPEQNPELYQERSPITYVERVTAPVLVLAGANDPRCPLRQIENYVTELSRLDKPHTVYRFDAGHGSLVVDQRIEMTRAELDFLRKTVPALGY